VTDVAIRQATAEDAQALHALIGAHLDEGHLLPRTAADLRAHAGRFVLCEAGGQIVACGELAPLSATVAEVRSLVVSREFRRAGLAAKLLAALKDRADQSGFATLATFTRDARFFVRQGFSIVPHVWLPEKIAKDCQVCSLFRQCKQYGLVLPLTAVPLYAPAPTSARQVAVA
jgi:amino-acid N-acetyltransferase